MWNQGGSAGLLSPTGADGGMFIQWAICRPPAASENEDDRRSIYIDDAMDFLIGKGCFGEQTGEQRERERGSEGGAYSVGHRPRHSSRSHRCSSLDSAAAVVATSAPPRRSPQSCRRRRCRDICRYFSRRCRSVARARNIVLHTFTLGS